MRGFSGRQRSSGEPSFPLLPPSPSGAAASPGRDDGAGAPAAPAIAGLGDPPAHSPGLAPAQLVSVFSLKWSPGASTLACLLARHAAGLCGQSQQSRLSREALLIDLDPFGGSLATSFGLSSRLGAVSLLAAAVGPDGSLSVSPQLLREHSQPLADHLRVVPGLYGLRQLGQLEQLSPALRSAIFSAPGTWAVVDMGRLVLSPGIRSLIQHSSTCLWVAFGSLHELVWWQQYATTLRGLNHRLGLVVVSGTPQHARDFAAAAEAPLVAHTSGWPPEVWDLRVPLPKRAVQVAELVWNWSLQSS